MNLYLLSQTECTGYDTYDACVVCAASEEEARKIHPSEYSGWNSNCSTWASSPDKVSVFLLGRASPDLEPGLILSSFNAG